MAALTRQAPEEEAVFAGILTGKIVEDSGDAAKTGMELLEKYGYELKDSLKAGALPGMAGGMALLLAAGLAACAGLAWHSMRLKREARERADYLEEKLKEETVRNQKMEAELRREEQETKSLITDISHQLKTPVASLKMSYEIEDSTELSAEETEEFRRKEREDVERLEHLLQAFTQMSKLETGMIRLKPEKAGVKATLARAVAGAYAKAVDKNISIETEECTDTAVVHDPGWTAEAIGNVLDNGVKYAPAGTCITIRVSELVSYVMIEVEDEGPGIPAEEQPRIFQRFYRGKAEAVRKAEGSGVGLYLTRRILEEQGGTVCVKSGRTGGSKFVITLPKE